MGKHVSDDTLVSIRDLKVHFGGKGLLKSRREDVVRAVDGVTLDIRRGETLGLVGESGCGKSTLGRALMRLEDPREGSILFEGEDLAKARGQGLRDLRKDMQVIFQDPMSSLDPRMKIRRIIAEGLVIGGVPKAERDARVGELIEIVGLRREHLDRYPHEFSGGQRQRIGIARALAMRPKFVVADEPVSALDVSIQSQVLNLLSDLQDSFGLTYLFIAHDLSVVEYISDRVGVMYLGRLVELADTADLYANPLMPYTQALLSAIPDREAETGEARIILKGDVPSPRNPPSGCPFRTRCWRAEAACAETRPDLREIRPRHWAACHFAE
ncbi:ABC transporter ATP-binding protein [Poseidonocella sp. HB161398]|uniref:ABC transporter ATP-binding protein n=1 Tax=Poseidonocella sp. HB161398 TaxID=2320855 RepID=UPI0011085D9C|nr:oligopeptide/dipeptide ABC transporter ATP-binding protein [Poseidonocella sp. HB161398]